MSKRFIVDEKNIKKVGDNIVICGKEAHHINVLRHRVKDILYINEYKAKVVGVMEVKGIPTKNITLMQAYLKSDKMEYVVQKAVELGAKEIKPILSKNCVVKLDEKDKIKKCERLNKIAKEAVEQCGRGDNVIVNNVEILSKVDFSVFDAVLILHEASTNSLKEAIHKIEDTSKIAVIVGPEGGLEQKEVEGLLNNPNTYVVSLGERILRAETASFAILSILGYEFN